MFLLKKKAPKNENPEANMALFKQAGIMVAYFLVARIACNFNWNQ